MLTAWTFLLSFASPSDEERAALTELGTACGSRHWVRNANWLSAAHVCDWELVGCDGAGRVKVLALDFNNLTGSLPASIGRLQRLQDLDLEHNALSGAVPSTLGSLGSLVQLGLGGNRFEGPLPAATCAPLRRILAGAAGAAACDLSGVAAFACPLPCAEAAVCGATCGGGANATSWRSINAVTLATTDMRASVAFYRKLGLFLTYGGAGAPFSTLSSANSSADGAAAIAHVNLNASSEYTPPPAGRWNAWGRVIVYVADVDASYRLARAEGLLPEAAPADAPWGERFFQILDPMGHELAISEPLAVAARGGRRVD